MKLFLLVLLVVLLLCLIGFYLFISSAPPLPDGAEEIIAEAIQAPLPEQFTGETGIATSSGLNIWYNVMTPVDSPKATILLVMGHSTSSLGWNAYFYQPLVDQGYRVIRYDNRGLGMSDWVEDWKKSNAYSLEDMASDGIAILDHLGIEQAHVFGVSMGGMIAQRLAIDYPDRILTLTSVMSTGYFEDPELTQVERQWYLDLIKTILKYGLIQSEKNRICLSIGIKEMLQGNGQNEYDLEQRAFQTLYEVRMRKGYNPKVRKQHTQAVHLSGSRYDELPQLQMPALIVHGVEDPLVLIEHSKKYAPMIPNAEQLWIEGMGHDLPEMYIEQIHEALFELFERQKLNNQI